MQVEKEPKLSVFADDNMLTGNLINIQTIILNKWIQGYWIKSMQGNNFYISISNI